MQKLQLKLKELQCQNDREQRTDEMKLKEMEYEMVLKQLGVNIAPLRNDVTFDFTKNSRLVSHFDESKVM